MKSILILFALLIFSTGVAYADCSNPPGVLGEIVFNDTYSVPQYCDATDNWIAMTSKERDVYRANAVKFANVNNNVGGDFLISNSKEITISIWVKKERDDLGNLIEQWVNRFFLGVEADESIDLQIWGVGTGNRVLHVNTPPNVITVNRWHHILISVNVDGANPSNVQVYVDDVDVSPTTSTLIDDIFDFTGTFHIFENGGDGWLGGIADLWIDSSYLDLSIEENRRKFIDENKNPTFLGANGNLPTGSPPEIFLSGDTDTWHVNKGTGGGFSENGTLTAADSYPYNSRTEIVPDGLVGHWRLDETSGTSVFDSSGNGNTLSTGGGLDLSVNTVSGKVSKGFSFNGSSEYLSGVPCCDLGKRNSFAFWIRLNEYPPDLDSGFGKSGENTRHVLIDSNGRLGFGVEGISRVTMVPPASIDFTNWTHLAFSRDEQIIEFFVNGESLGTQTLPTNADTRIDRFAWRSTSSDTQYLDGAADDIRIYDRPLSADEVMALYQAADGIRYNQNHRTYEYFDGNRHVSMTPSWPEPNPLPYGYEPNAVSFDGVNDYLHEGSLSGSNPTLITGSFWFKRDPNNVGTSQAIVHNRNAASEYFRVRFSSGNEFVIDGREPGDGPYSQILKSNMTITDGNWYHVVFSLDSTNRALDQLYINDVDDTDSTPNTISAFGGGQQWAIGAFAPGGTEKYYGDLADLWIDFDNKIDLSVEANRRAFIDAGGKPVNLGSDGSAPTGSAPDIFLSGDTDSWHTNKGTGGGFTENGALTTATTSPHKSGSLVAHWKLDETSGTVAVNAANPGTHDGAMQAGLDAGDDTALGAVGTAINFDNTNYIEVAHDANFNLTSSITLAAWFNVSGPNPVYGAHTIVSKGENDAGDILEYEMDFNEPENSIRCMYKRSDTGLLETPQVNDSVTHGVWQHGACVYNLTALTVTSYVNGQYVAKRDILSGEISQTGTDDINIGRRFHPTTPIEYMFGKIDDVRIYDRPLSAAEIQKLYQMGTPVGASTALPQSCPNIGDVCDDGTIYAGLSDDGSIEMYTTPADEGQYYWNDGNTSNSAFTQVSVYDEDTGYANTNQIIAVDSDSETADMQLHQAAQACYDLSYAHNTDWYLPAVDELKTLCDNKAAIGNFTDQKYHSSTELDASNIRQLKAIDFDGCGQQGQKKDNNHFVRCVRKGPAPRCANPYGLEGQMIFNTTHDVVQFCDGARWIAIGKYGP